ncbi:mucin-desulfating sulfatase N-acetylglucosamine-6-sulfatase [Nitzschia inconspicua]|uniref:Mucin-desulfating sulfatase N-acetylglucosamine-6-sulfatase n=1 Tax=Nitzschia inconspicua TaxID=303405 RepID=A0A9K3Q178_9STRA|nr:mucin-desulfating sulfatase N-acetylglucosamine-6-sulfatase [Nitzschia inconspicua]
MGVSSASGKPARSKTTRRVSWTMLLSILASASILVVHQFFTSFHLRSGSIEADRDALGYLPPTDESNKEATGKNGGYPKPNNVLLTSEKLTNPTREDEPPMASTAEKPNPPLNILILYPDDWRHDTLGGVAPVVQTPYLNRLAEQGIRFTHNMVTTSICWISRATLFTGMYAARHKSYRLRQPEFYKSWHNMTWPSLLREAGYFVGHIGKWQFYNPNKTVESFFHFAKIFEGQHQYNVRTAAERARDLFDKFLVQKPDNMPFAATIAFYPPKAIGQSKVPGAQYRPKPEFRQKYYFNVTVPYPPYDINASYHKLPWFFHTFGNDARRRWEERYGTTLQYQESMKNYYSLVTEVDEACREIVENLKRRNLLNNTMIIFTTDNGLFHAAHGLAGKWYPYQESIRVPLIVSDPRMTSKYFGTTDDSLTLNIDLASTILGAAGIKAPDRMQGRDISELYLDDKEDFVAQKPWRNDFYYEFPLDNGNWMPQSNALVRRDYKYIYWPTFQHEEIFNLTEDPYELTNQVNHSNYQELLVEMRERYSMLQAEAE